MTCNRPPRNPPPSSSLRLLRLRSFLFALLEIYLVVASPGQSSAQKDLPKHYALIFGTVWGPDDRPAYGVKVRIRRSDQKHAKWELYSDHHGEFAQRVPAEKADYLVGADLKGFKTFAGKQLRGDEVPVHIEGDERVDIGVHLRQ